MSKHDIVLVPGFWEGPDSLQSSVQLLRKDGYITHVAPLRSTGVPYRENPKSPSLHDDVATVCSVIKPLVEEGKDIVLLLHSASSFIGSHAIEGLSKVARAKEGKKGGVDFIAFLTAGVYPEGASTGPMPFFDVKGPELWCKDQRKAAV
jgi:hypothetical protein